MSRYIALEGVDGSGKSTVAAGVASWLSARGHEVLSVREPGGSALGEEIRKLLLHSSEMTPWAEAALFAAQRAQLVAEVVRPALARGAWVISDRSYYSSLAYQGAARGLGVDAVRILNETVLDGVVPDLVVILQVEPEMAMSRQRHPDRIGSVGLEFQQMVAEAFERLAADEPGRVVLVPGDEDVESVVERVLDHVMLRHD